MVYSGILKLHEPKILFHLYFHAIFSGSLLQVMEDKPKSGRGRLGSFTSSFKQNKENVRQVFLFTYHILLTTRASNGRLHLAKVGHDSLNIGQEFFFTYRLLLKSKHEATIETYYICIYSLQFGKETDSYYV